MRVGLRVPCVGLLLAIGAAPSARAQAQQAVVLKGKAPVSDSILKVRLPRPTEFDLPNGLHLMVLEDHRAPIVSFTLLIPGAGGYFDPVDVPGLATFTAAMMREGTSTRSSSEISSRLETMAAGLTVSTGMSSPDATVSGSSLSEFAAQLLDITADVLLNPSFPDEELVRYKQRMQAQLTQQRANPGFLANEMFSRVTFGNHPAARVSPTAATLAQVTRAQLAEFHRAHIAPDHAALAIAGDITPAEARKVVEAKLGGWRKAGAPAVTLTDPAALGSTKVYLVDRANSVQTNFVVGTQAIERTNPDYDVLQVANKILGGGPTGRLFVHLREEKGYTYGAYSAVTAGRFRGSWSASTDVRSDVTQPALRDLLAEVSHMRDSTVPARELLDQQRSLVASFALSLESPQQMLGYYITSWTYRLPADYWDKYPARVMAVTAVQVQAASKKYLDPSRLEIVAVGDGKQIEAILKGFGELEVYDTDGKPAVKKTT